MAHMSSDSPCYKRILTDFTLCPPNDKTLSCSLPLEWNYLKPEEEIAQVGYGKSFVSSSN